MRKLMSTLVIAFLMLNVIRVTTNHDILTAESFLQITKNYFELNDIGEPLNSAYTRLMLTETFADAFDTEIIYEADNMLAGFFEYVMQAVGGIGEILQFYGTWLWNISIGWISKLLAYILTLLGLGKY